MARTLRLAAVSYAPPAHDHRNKGVELKALREMVLKVSQGKELAERFPEHRRSLLSRLPTVNEVNREQVELLRRFRGAQNEAEREAYKSAVLLSINTVAAGLGATG